VFLGVFASLLTCGKCVVVNPLEWVKATCHACTPTYPPPCLMLLWAGSLGVPPSWCDSPERISRGPGRPTWCTNMPCPLPREERLMGSPPPSVEDLTNQTPLPGGLRTASFVVCFVTSGRRPAESPAFGHRCGWVKWQPKDTVTVGGIGSAVSPGPAACVADPND